MAASKPVEKRAPAKINLALHVTGQRADGYHEIETLALFCRADDRLSVGAAPRDSLAIHGRFAAALDAADPANLVARARDALRAHGGAKRCGAVAIALEKNLPVAAGLGGGSADAAAALRALNAHWDLGLAPDALAALGAGLGADIAMCLQSRPLLARGIGERIDILEAVPAMPVVLVNPGGTMVTASVFAALTCKTNPPLPAIPAIRDPAGLAHWIGATRNDLQAPAMAMAPQIDAALAALGAKKPLAARMTGSGATCFALFETPAQAGAAAKSIRAGHPDWYVQATQTIASNGAADEPH